MVAMARRRVREKRRASVWRRSWARRFSSRSARGFGRFHSSVEDCRDPPVRPDADNQQISRGPSAATTNGFYTAMPPIGTYEMRTRAPREIQLGFKFLLVVSTHEYRVPPPEPRTAGHDRMAAAAPAPTPARRLFSSRRSRRPDSERRDGALLLRRCALVRLAGLHQRLLENAEPASGDLHGLCGCHLR